jgi:hypothetical protein
MSRATNSLHGLGVESESDDEALPPGRVCHWVRSRKLRRSGGIGSVGERRSAWITTVCCTRGRGLAGMESAGSGESGLNHELGWSAGRRCGAYPPGADTGRQPPKRDTMSVCGEPASPMRQHTHTYYILSRPMQGAHSRHAEPSADEFWDLAARDPQQQEISCSRQPRRRCDPQDRSSVH